ncbi:hypothetical protein HZC07_01125, partial [Candidatus Micrarchaeota archaeon]|nr:hypothetical protein [Candidatus Micrarchaeota archaeon]
MKDESVTFSKDTFYGFVIVVLAGLLVLSIFTQGFGLIKPTTTVPTPVPNPTPTPSPTPTPNGPL